MADSINAAGSALTLETVLTAALHVPGVKVNRTRFLQIELSRHCPEMQVQEAILSSPAKAGISRDTVNIISKQVIDYETAKVTGASFLTSLPGGAAAVGSAATDIVFYFASILRTAQKLAYLYGFEQFELREDDMDSETMNFLLLFMGVMFGVQGASSALQQFTNTFARHVAKKLAQKALMKTAYYPVIKEICKKIGIKMTKQIFADTVASFIPLAGGALSGGLTYAMFRPGCMRLRKNLMSSNLCDPDYFRDAIEVEYYDAEAERHDM